MKNWLISSPWLFGSIASVLLAITIDFQQYIEGAAIPTNTHSALFVTQVGIAVFLSLVAFMFVNRRPA